MAKIIVSPYAGKTCTIIDCFDQYFYVKIDDTGSYIVITPKHLKFDLDEASDVKLTYSEFLSKNNFYFLQKKEYWKIVTDHPAKQ